MKAAEWISLISALGASGGVAAYFSFLKDRKKLSVDARVAERTELSQVGLVSIQELEAKLSYLNRVITVLEEHNVRLEGDLEKEYNMNQQLGVRVRELVARCDKLEAVVRKLCLDNNLDPDLYL